MILKIWCTDSNQIKRDSDNKEKIYSDHDGEFRNFCHVCDILAIDRDYNNHLKSQTHINNFPKRQQIDKTSFSTQSQKFLNKMNIKFHFIEDYENERICLKNTSTLLIPQRNKTHTLKYL